MAQQEQALTARPDNLNSIPQMHTVEGDNWVFLIVL